eukprot:2415721-Rhodomonas_salina.1
MQSTGKVGTVVRYDVDPATLAASLLGVSPDLVTTWSVVMELSDAEACQPPEQIRQLCRERFLVALADAASP